MFYDAADGQLTAVAVNAQRRFEAGAATGLFELRGFWTISTGLPLLRSCRRPTVS